MALWLFGVFFLSPDYLKIHTDVFIDENKTSKT